MAIIDGLNRTMKAIANVASKFGGSDNPSVTVGFTQGYAVFVHENKESAHTVGQAKFLEEPARRLNSSKELARIARKVIQKTGKVHLALLTAGLRIQREAQELTPVDTGALKASAFTCYTKDVATESLAAYQRGEAQRAASGKHKKP